MKRKNQIIKRICAVLCALVVALATFGVSLPFYASDFGLNDLAYMHKNNLCKDDVFNYEMPSMISKYPYYIVTKYMNDKYYTVWCFDDVPSLMVSGKLNYTSELSLVSVKLPLGVKYAYHYYPDTNKWVSWSDPDSGYNYEIGSLCAYRVDGSFSYCNVINSFVCSNTDVYISGTDFCFYSLGPSYNSDFGYLQNVTRKSTYIRDALYNYDESSLTYHWTHDLTTTTGVDLSSGNYKIRHYISMATVTGYEKDDIVEMSDKYLVGEYDASDGGFSYLKKDYDDKIAAFGYENIGWVDKYLKGYFVLEHNYFQIVNSATNEVGGYLHFYPKDSDSDSFGVEYEYEGLDNDFVVDEDGPSGFIDNQTGSGLTHEDALENAEQPKLDDLSGVDELTANLDAYASQIGGVTNGIGALFGQLPPWIVGLLGLSVALSFAVVVFKVLRG